MPTDKRVPTLIVNTLTEAQYQALENPSDTEMWVTPYDESILPDQTGQSGKFLTTDGTDASWANIDALPSQTGQSGKFLKTDGSAASWATVNALPSQTGNEGKYLTTDGSTASWAEVNIPSGVYTNDNLVAGTNIEFENVTYGERLASGFTTNGYITIPHSVWTDKTNAWELNFRIKTPASGTNYRHRFFGSSNSTFQSLGITFQAYYTNGAFGIEMGLSSDGSSWDIGFLEPAAYNLQNDTWYWIKASYNGTDTYKVQLSTDGTNYTDYLSTTTNSKIYNTSDTSVGYSLGNASNGTEWPYGGIIDLAGFSIIENGVKTFNGMTAVAGTDFTISSDVTLTENTTEITKVNSQVSSFPLFTPQWQDHITNDASWLRADTFSWQSGAVYVSAYNHLVDDISGITAETETISGTTIMFYRATDGHKIVLADQESNVSAIYTATGVAWYYILDTVNTRFKLPRMLPIGDTAPVIGNGMTIGLTDSTNKFGISLNSGYGVTSNNQYGGDVGDNASGVPGDNGKLVGLTTEIDKSGIIADLSKSRTANDGAYKYLYFYVGNTVQDQTTIDVGEITDALNSKVDLPTNKTQNDVDFVVESYVNGTSWYRVWSDGWCEQGGYVTNNQDITTITFLKEFASTNYNISACAELDGNFTATAFITSKTATTVSVRAQYWQNASYTGVVSNFYWRAEGYIS